MNENGLTLQISVDDLQESLKELLVAAVLTKIDVLNGEIELSEETGTLEDVEKDILDFAIMYRNAAKDISITEWTQPQQNKLQTLTLLKRFEEMGVL